MEDSDVRGWMFVPLNGDAHACVTTLVLTLDISVYFLDARIEKLVDFDAERSSAAKNIFNSQ